MRGVEKKPDPATPDDNAASVGSVITFGQFRLIDLGDLLWNKEGELMCPNNPVGTVDLFMVTHHGLAQSNADALVHGVRPRVAVMQNGTRKGGAVAVFETPAQVAGARGRLAAALVVRRRHRAQRARRVHRQRGRRATIASVLTAPPGGGRGGRGGGAPGGGAPGDLARHRPPVELPRSAPAAGTHSGAVTPPAGAPRSTPPAGAQPPGGRSRASPGRAGWTRRARWARRPWRWRRWRSRGAHAGLLHQVSAQADGTFTVTNTRNGFSKTYQKRAN